MVEHSNCTCPICVPDKYFGGGGFMVGGCIIDQNGNSISIENGLTSIKSSPSRTEYAVEDTISQDHLWRIEDTISEIEYEEMKKKIEQIIGSMVFNDIKDRLLAQHAFKLGYLASFAKYRK